MAITLPHKFQWRDYQVEPWDVMIQDDFKRGILVWPRRNGKDLFCWNLLIAKAFKRVGLYYYMAPFYNQVRQIIWEGYTGDGTRFLDFIPPELTVTRTKIDMRIDLPNGSQIKLQGSDNIDRIVGTNPIGIVFTEFSLHKPEAWEYLRPILAENGGWAIFNGTPRGMNHFYQLYQKANVHEDWYSNRLSRDDTGVPTLEAIEEDRVSGMPEELIKQEYYTSFTAGLAGAYYAKYMERARADGRIGKVDYDPLLDTYTVWDLGLSDPTAIWFVQTHGPEIRLIDYYEDTDLGLEYYKRVLDEKGYRYVEHFAPHDLEVRELTTGRTRKELAERMGLNFTVLPKLPVQDGIDAVRSILSRCHFDERKCHDGIQALLSYRKDWKSRDKVYANNPKHDWASHGADAFRYLAIAIEDMTPRPEFGKDIRVLSQVRSNNRVYTHDQYLRDRRRWNARNLRRSTAA